MRQKAMTKPFPLEPDRAPRPRLLLPASGPRLAAQSQTPPPRPYQSSQLPRRRNVVSIACDNCRRAKVKCSAHRPVCSRCARNHQRCHFVGQPGETPAVALKRDNSTLRDISATQSKILELLTKLPEKEAQDVLQRMRDGVPLDTIYNQFMAGDALIQLSVVPESQFRYTLLYRPQMPDEFTRDNPYLDTLLYESTSLYKSQSPDHSSSGSSQRSVSIVEDDATYKSAFLMPFHAANVVEPLLSDVKPSDWTAVSKDDALMRDLLAVWFRCEYSFASAFQKDLFLEDMASHSQDFCSELLVNVVLAYCCVSASYYLLRLDCYELENLIIMFVLSIKICYPSCKDRAQYWNPKNLAYRFLAEGKRLWELEATVPRLTTIHAGLILTVFHNLSGLDEIGQAYRLNSVSLANTLGLFNGPIEAESERQRHGRQFTAWTLYNWEALTAFSFQQPPLLVNPPFDPLPDPGTQSRWYGEIWTKYPNDQHLSPSHFGQLFKAKAQFRIIMQQFCTKAYTTGIKVSGKEANNLYSALKDWENGLPAPLQARQIVLPSHLQLHVYLQHLTLAIFEPLVEDVLAAELQDQPHPRNIVVEANRNLQTLIRLYYLRHGFEAMDLFIVIPLIYAGFKCLEAISDQTSEADLHLMRSTLMLVVSGLYQQRRNHHLAETLYRVLRGRMRPEEAILAKETLELKDDESEDMLSLKQAVRSHWPVSIVKRKEDLNAHILANLVEDLTLSKDGKDKAKVTEHVRDATGQTLEDGQ